MDLPLPVELGEQLITEGRGQPHRHHGDAGWTTHPLRESDDVDEARSLLGLAHAPPAAVKSRDEPVSLPLSDDARSAFRTAVKRAG